MGASGLFKFMRAASDILGLKQCKPLTFASGLCQEEPEVLGAQTCPKSGGKPGKVRNGSSVFQWLRNFSGQCLLQSQKSQRFQCQRPLRAPVESIGAEM